MKNSLLFAGLYLALVGCSSIGQSTRPAEVAINFAAYINGKPFACGERYANVGVTRSTILPSDYRIFVSDIKLVRKDGSTVPVALNEDGVWQHKNVALLDFENGTGPCRNGTAATNTTVRGVMPAGEFVGLELTVGVPFALNHQDPTVAVAPFNSTAMFWNWQGGYKFIKFDTTSSGISEDKPAAASAQGPVTRFSVHLGSTACASASRTQAPTSCQNPNLITVRLANFNPQKNTVVVDMGAVLEQANVDVNAPGTSPGCMSFPKDGDCPPIMSNLGLAYDGVAGGLQRLISMR